MDVGLSAFGLVTTDGKLEHLSNHRFCRTHAAGKGRTRIGRLNLATLDIGCGTRKTPGALGIDLRPLPGVDAIADFDGAGLPFAESSFDMIIASDVIEHSKNVVRLMEEIHRVGRDGCPVHIRVPFFAGQPLHDDPTHERGFTHKSFDYFCPGRSYYSYGYTKAAFSVESVRYEADHVRPNPLDRLLVSLCDRHKDVYERRFAFIYPVSSISFVLRVLKPASPAQQDYQ